MGWAWETGKRDKHKYHYFRLLSKVYTNFCHFCGELPLDSSPTESSHNERKHGHWRFQCENLVPVLPPGKKNHRASFEELVHEKWRNSNIVFMTSLTSASEALPSHRPLRCYYESLEAIRPWRCCRRKLWGGKLAEEDETFKRDLVNLLIDIWSDAFQMMCGYPELKTKGGWHRRDALEAGFWLLCWVLTRRGPKS